MTNTEIYTLSLHDALPIYSRKRADDDAGASADRRQTDHAAERAFDRLAAVGIRLAKNQRRGGEFGDLHSRAARALDRKSTRLNSSHANISYAVFCLKKKKI